MCISVASNQFVTTSISATQIHVITDVLDKNETLYQLASEIGNFYR